MSRSLESLSFLIIDDNVHMRTLIRQILYGLNVKRLTESADGAQALKELRVRMPDIVLTDWRMSPIDGIELTRFIRQSSDSPNPFVPIIMISAYSEKQRVTEARDAGINEFVVKPFSAKLLYTRLWSVIDNPRPFVRTKSYFGPDRRRRRGEDYHGPERRNSGFSEIDAATDKPETADAAAEARRLNQDEVNAIFSSD